MISQAMVARTNISLAFLMLLLCTAGNPSLVLWYSFYFLYNFLLCLGSKGPNQVDGWLCFLTIFCTWKVCSCTFNTIYFMLHDFALNSVFPFGQPSRKCYLTTLWITEICPEILFAFCSSVASFQSQGNVNSVTSLSLAPKFLFDELHYIPLFVGLKSARLGTIQKKGCGDLALAAPHKQSMYCNRGNKEVISCIILPGLPELMAERFTSGAQDWDSFYPPEICTLKTTASIRTYVNSIYLAKYTYYVTKNIVPATLGIPCGPCLASLLCFAVDSFYAWRENLEKQPLIFWPTF